MTYREALTAISTRLRAGFTALQVVVDPNNNLKLPDAGAVTLTFTTGGSLQHSRGGMRALFLGTLSADLGVFVPKGRGRDTAWDAVEAICALFRGWANADLLFVSERPEEVGDTKDGRHYQLNLVLVFEKFTDQVLAS